MGMWTDVKVEIIHDLLMGFVLRFLSCWETGYWIIKKPSPKTLIEIKGYEADKRKRVTKTHFLLHSR